MVARPMARRRLVPSVDGMNILRKSFIALSLTCGAAWLLKQVVIVASGGGDAESPLIAVLWATGMITFVLASATGTALALRRLADVGSRRGRRRRRPGLLRRSERGRRRRRRRLHRARLVRRGDPARPRGAGDGGPGVRTLNDRREAR